MSRVLEKANITKSDLDDIGAELEGSVTGITGDQIRRGGLDTSSFDLGSAATADYTNPWLLVKPVTTIVTAATDYQGTSDNVVLEVDLAAALPGLNPRDIMLVEFSGVCHVNHWLDQIALDGAGLGVLSGIDDYIATLRIEYDIGTGYRDIGLRWEIGSLVTTKGSTSSSKDGGGTNKPGNFYPTYGTSPYGGEPTRSGPGAWQHFKITAHIPLSTSYTSLKARGVVNPSKTGVTTGMVEDPLVTILSGTVLTAKILRGNR